MSFIAPFLDYLNPEDGYLQRTLNKELNIPRSSFLNSLSAFKLITRVSFVLFGFDHLSHTSNSLPHSLSSSSYCVVVGFGERRSGITEVGEAIVLTATADSHARTDYPNMTVADTSTALLAFDTGAKGVLTATCLLEGISEIYLKLICEGYLITITITGITIEDKTGTRELKHANTLLEIQNRAFLKAVGEADSSHLYSSYRDALQTHDLCFDVLEASLI